MTAFTTAQLPTGDSEITTVEGLKVWCDLILNENYSKLQIVRQESELPVSLCRLNFYEDKDNLSRNECVSQVRLTQDWKTSGRQPWTQVIEFGTVPIPSRFSGD